jgi:hypothetical protein
MRTRAVATTSRTVQWLVTHEGSAWEKVWGGGPKAMLAQTMRIITDCVP